jgi:hypothetical protein
VKAVLGGVLGLGLVSACPEPKSASNALRVPLPTGWVATAVPGGLTVGPKGRVVATLELRPQPVPRASELRDAVTDEGASGVLVDDGEGYAAVRYRLGAERDAFLASKRVGARTVFCASTAQATPSEVDEGLALCRQLGVED